MTYPRGPLAIADDIDRLIDEIIAADIDADVHALEDMRGELWAEAERRQVAIDKEYARFNPEGSI